MPLNAPSLPSKSALEPHEEELKRKKELLAKVRVLREKMASRAADFTGQNPAKTYIWVNIKEDRQTYFQAWGYILCTDPKVSSPYKQPDGSHKRADLVLYEMDREMYEAIQADNQIRGLEGIEGHKEAAIASMHRHGVREFIPAVK